MWPFKKRSHKRRRSYDAAKSNRLVSSWVTAPVSADYDIRAGMTVLRARSRDLYQNNDMARQFVRLSKVNIIGPRGIQVQSRVNMRKGDPDHPARDAIEAAFKEWSRRGSADATGKRSWWQLQNDFIQSIAVDGEFLAIEETVRPWGYRLKVLDPELLPIDFNENLANGNAIRSSIEYNSDGRPVAYWLRDQSSSPWSSSAVTVDMSQRRRIPADRIIHEYLPEFAVQGRGVPWMAAGMYRLGMLKGYEEAEMIAARVSAAAMGFFEQGEDSDGGEYTGDMADPDNDDDFEMEAEPGVFRTLPRGLTLKEWSPNRPNTAFDAFVGANLRAFSSGVGVSYSSLSNDYTGANYSSLRQALLVERDIWQCLQTWASEALHDRVYGNWLESALLFGRISIQGQEPVRPVEEYLPHDWQPRRWQWVDPQKELTAIKTALDMRIRSAPEVIREMGRDPAAVLAEITEWKNKLDAAGISESQAMDMVVATSEENNAE